MPLQRFLTREEKRQRSLAAGECFRRGDDKQGFKLLADIPLKLGFIAVFLQEKGVGYVEELRKGCNLAEYDAYVKKYGTEFNFQHMAYCDEFHPDLFK